MTMSAVLLHRRIGSTRKPSGVHPGRSIAVGVFLLMATHAVHAASVWSLALTSEAGDPIGLGETYSYATADGSLSTPNVLDLNSDGLVDYLTFAFLSNDSSRSFEFTVGAASFVNSNTGNLAVGQYANATKAAFAGDTFPGLDITLNGLTPVELLGSFSVSDASFFSDQNGLSVDSVALRFFLVASGAAGGISGVFNYSSGLSGGGTSPVPLPGAVYLLVSGFVLLGGLARRRGKALGKEIIDGMPAAR